ncbi:PREDICTED: uncharacterized protein LOC107097073 [Cyprinodon variegatus]|uniref:uncharacterized protein LOC107097073 n=1 Tax=Cyprinodon variegatus TaxID=28743 RepID=UPI000742ADEE|nr:PREDICTED: uncharacterized protein LOC107097073 [Cyprinodon variegatus]
MTKDMFPHFSKALVKTLGSSSDLISNRDLNRNWELMTLVKVKKKDHLTFLNNWKRYKPLDLKLRNIVKEDLFLEPEIEPLVKDYKNCSEVDGSVEVEGGDDKFEGKLKGHQDRIDSSSIVSFEKEQFSSKDMENLTMTTFEVDPNIVHKLKMKEGEKLAFVKQRIYNTNEIQVSTKTCKSGSFGLKLLHFFSLGFEVSSHGKGY